MRGTVPIIIVAIVASLFGCRTRAPSGLLLNSFREPYQRRDPRGAGGFDDRLVVFLYLKLIGKHSLERPEKGYFDGDCAKAPDEEQRLFCEGKYEELSDPDLAYFGMGTGPWSNCQMINHADLAAYCQGTVDTGRSHHYECDRIEHPSLRYQCEYRNSTLRGYCQGPNSTIPQSKHFRKCSSGSGEPATEDPTPAEPPKRTNCRYPGEAVSDANDCCSRRAEPSRYVTNSNRTYGRDKTCITE